MRDGQGCLLPILPSRLLLVEEEFMAPWLLPRSCRAEVPSQFPHGPPSDPQKRPKLQRMKLQCLLKAHKIDGKLLRAFAQAAHIDFSAAHVRGKTSCHSQQEEADQNPDDTSFLPGLDDETALRCLAFVSRSDHGRLSRVSQRHHQFVRSTLLFDLRRRYGVVEQWVYMFTASWTAFDSKRNAWMHLPPTNADPNFDLSDRESLSAGTHLLWFGMELFDFVCYRYDLVTNSWEKGPSMVNPRCLFASASSGEFAFVAGGFGRGENGVTVLSSAERYDSRIGRWDPLPSMMVARQKCSGFFMDGKFWVIGGKDGNHEPVTSGEEYDPSRGTWRIVEDMYPAPTILPMDSFEPSPPLVAVVGNQLYALEISSNLLKLYEKGSNTWKILGPVPVRADYRNGWGLAFKAVGDELFVIGEYRDSSHETNNAAVFAWRPGPDSPAPEWRMVTPRVQGSGNFLYNCAVMAC